MTDNRETAVIARKGKHTMTAHRTVAFAVAGLTAVSLFSAPIAGARPTCQETNTKKVCNTNGSTSIKAKPGTLAPPATNPVIPWLGMPGAG